MAKGIYKRTEWHRELSRKALLCVDRTKAHLNLGKYSKKGAIPWSKGKKLPSVSRAIRARNLKNPIKYWLGKKRPEMSGENHWFWGKHPNKGTEHPRWTGGKYSESYRQRRLFRFAIQKKVFERDNYTCQLCSERGGDLQVDHIQSWKDYVELRFNIENCRTLCVECHYQVTFGKPMPPTVRAWGHNLSKGGLHS